MDSANPPSPPLRQTGSADRPRHALWVRLSHWLVTLAFLALAFSGYVILMCHPRLYWGETGNDLTPALIELPISRNHRHGGWEKPVPFFEGENAPVSASRTYEIFNQNGWGRSLHFLAGWFLVAGGAAYFVGGVVSRHFQRHLLPRAEEIRMARLREDLASHLRLRVRPPTGGPQYGPLQKCAYVGVVFLGVPLAVVTGLAMSPAVTAAFPFLSDVFGGTQSARTIHFFTFVVLVLFLGLHVAMVIRSGFKRHLRAMTVGEE